MNQGKTKVEKRYVCNTNLAKTEKWLRDQSKCGWKLTQVKSGIIRTTFVFTKAIPCDRLYFAYASFYKLPKLESTSRGVFYYIKNQYGGKPIPGKHFDRWFCIKRNDTTNLEDIRKNLQYRENCIRKAWLLFFVLFAICGGALIINNFLSKGSLRFDAVDAMCGLGWLVTAIKLISHNISCKKAYADFAEDSLAL